MPDDQGAHYLSSRRFLITRVLSHCCCYFFVYFVFKAAPRFRDSVTRVSVKRDSAASLHCRVDGDRPLQLAWRRSPASPIASNYRYTSVSPFSPATAYCYRASTGRFRNEALKAQLSHCTVIIILNFAPNRVHIAEKEVPGGVVSSITIPSAQVDDVSFHVQTLFHNGLSDFFLFIYRPELTSAPPPTVTAKRRGISSWQF